MKSHPRLYGALGLIRRKPLITLDYPIHPQPRYGHGLPAHPQLHTLIGTNRGRYRSELKKISPLQVALHNIPKHLWQNDFLPALDAATLYSFTAQLKPRRYFEIGSGISTRFVNRAIQDHNLLTKVTSIDPRPRADIDQICHQVIRKPLEQTDLAIFKQLDKDDILFVDNSHQSFQNSDVTVFFLDVLPNLKPGVLVGIHDILLPDDYPPSYAQNYYSEQYLLACWLLGGGQNIDIVLPNWFCSGDPELSSIIKPLFFHPNFHQVDTHGCAFWLNTR